MTVNFEQQLEKYATLAIKVGLNLRPGQNLLIRKATLDAAPFVRLLAAKAYQNGARLVDVMWEDEGVKLARFKYASPDSFSAYPEWRAQGAARFAMEGDALLSVASANPDLLSDQDPELLSTFQRTEVEHLRPLLERTSKNSTNWLVIGAAVPGWAAKVFPDVPADEQVDRLWEVLFDVCRINQDDPVQAWQEHIDDLLARCGYMNTKQYSALRLTGPGTDLTVGLPQGHLWQGARSVSQNNISFTANIPTEEIFTMPHKDRTEGVVRATMPLSYKGSLIEDFSLTFSKGRVVDATAKTGEAVLRKFIETDEGAGRLGELALVPNSSPIAQTGILFYNTLLDENASCHIALGRAYRTTVSGGADMSDEAFAAAGGNSSLIHIDFMIGSGELDVDGIRDDGVAEPVMRGGEWVFEA